MSYHIRLLPNNTFLKIVLLPLLVFCFSSCNHSEASENGLITKEETFSSTQVNGKWTTDFKTAEELKVMRNTIENFTLLNKKKFENLKAYQEFGDLMAMHIERVSNNCGLDEKSKVILQSKLERMNVEVNILHGSDMEKSKLSIKKVNEALADIDSTFSYTN
jgi:hypothetical protein